MNFLVTGGAGYIGSVLVGMLLLREDKVRVFDKLYFDEKPLEDLKKRYGHKLEIIQGDVRNFHEDILDGIEAVVHLGALSNDPTADFDPKATVDINFKGTINVAEACKKKGIKRFSFASSAAVYGFHVDSVADEEFIASPQSEYAKSRLDSDIALMKMADENFFLSASGRQQYMELHQDGDMTLLLILLPGMLSQKGYSGLMPEEWHGDLLLMSVMLQKHIFLL